MSSRTHSNEHASLFKSYCSNRQHASHRTTTARNALRVSQAIRIFCFSSKQVIRGWWQAAAAAHLWVAHGLRQVWVQHLLHLRVAQHLLHHVTHHSSCRTSTQAQVCWRAHAAQPHTGTPMWNSWQAKALRIEQCCDVRVTQA